jgi:Glycosyl transferase family 90
VQLVCRALRNHDAAIIAALPESLTEMTLYLNVLDHPTLHPGNVAKAPKAMKKWALPIFSWCAGPQAYDVAVPDFSFMEYPEAAGTTAPVRHHRFDLSGCCLVCCGKTAPVRRH